MPMMMKNLGILRRTFGTKGYSMKKDLYSEIDKANAKLKVA